MRRPRWIFGLLLPAAAGCPRTPETPALTAPRTGTSHVLYGTVTAGRRANPTGVRIARARETDSVELDPIGGGELDMFFVGLRAEDLPTGIEPEGLRFLSERDERAHGLPPLLGAHVLRRPSLPNRPEPLVPVEEPTLDASLAAERKARLETMLEDLAIQDPCVDVNEPITITAPRTPAEEATTLRALSSGETFVGFSATSTTIMGVIRPDEEELRLVRPPALAAEPLPKGIRTRITDLGDTEVRSPEGRMLPGEIALNLDSLRAVGLLAVWSDADAKYVDGSPADIDSGSLPATAALPSRFHAARHLDVEPEGALCVLGSAQGIGNGAIWCRALSSAPRWRLAGFFPDAIALVEATEHRGLPPLAFDLAGAIYLYEGGSWSPILRAAVNDACPPLCSKFTVAVSPVPGSNIVAVLSSSDGHALALSGGTKADLAVSSISSLSDALFSSERFGSETAMRFSASVIAPDGTIWLGSDAPVLLRITEDLERTDRICLPADARGAIVTALEADPGGRLLIGMTPALLGFGRWR